MNFLFRHILSSPWLINESFANMVMPEVSKFLKGENPAVPAATKEAGKYIIDPNGNTVRDKSTWDGFVDSFDNAPEGSVAVIEVNGVMFKETQHCGPVGMVTLMEQFSRAQSNKNIVGIIISMDTPGGQVNGTYDFSQLVKKSKKPTVTYITGYCCSAGYWVGSSSNHIMANNELAEIGSIGTMCRVLDDSGALEKEGYKVITIRATNSTLKNEAYYQALAGNEAPIRAQLDYINTYFTKSVTQNRKGKLSDQPSILQGEVFFAKDAIKNGMIDAIGTMEDAIAFIKNNSKTSKNTKMSTTTPRTNLNATLGITENHASTDEGVFLQDSELDTIEASMAASATLQAENERLTAENASIATLQASLDAANTTIATNATRIKELEAEVERLGNEPAGSGTNPAGSADRQEASKTPYVKDGSEETAQSFGIK